MPGQPVLPLLPSGKLNQQLPRKQLKTRAHALGAEVLWCEVKARRRPEPGTWALCGSKKTSRSSRKPRQPAPDSTSPFSLPCPLCHGAVSQGLGHTSGSVLCEEIVFSERPSQEESGGLGWKKSLPPCSLGVCDGPQRERSELRQLFSSLGYTVNHLGV